MLPEIFRVFTWHHTTYSVLITLDAILALMTGASGEGLSKGGDGAPRMALRAAGVTLATSLGWGIHLARELARLLNESGGVLDWIFIPRLLFYAVAVAFWPYGVRALIVAAPPECRKGLWLTFGAWLALGAVLALIPYIAIR
ncbi:MAG: hypothetical protein HY293_09775 [Planctomycetes bacterium]|nr:hypothetical protein [Planctomycetota bacterium]